MPNLAIIDAHVHLWDPRRLRMPWLDGNALLNKPYGLYEYGQHTRSVEVEGIVYVQVEVSPAYALLEAQWVAELAKHDPRIKAIVAYAPLEDGTCVRSYLDALVQIDPKIRGVRRIVQSEPDVNFSLRPDFVLGVQQLADYNLTCDLCIYHPQLAATIELVRRCPNVQFILDHIGKPGIREHELEPWRTQLSELASLPNVICKISGVVTEADHTQWQPVDLAPYIEHVLAVFGEDRIVYGGDWPVILNASEYQRWIDTLDSFTATLSPAAKQKLWNSNAKRFYRISE